MITLTAKQSTKLKAKPIDSSNLNSNEVVDISYNCTFQVHSFAKAENSHYRVALLKEGKPVKLGRAGKNTWYLYTPHWDLGGIDIEEKEELTKEVILIPQPIIPTPATINWLDFNDRVSKYFSVGEVSQYDQRRVVSTDTLRRNVYNLAQHLDRVREDYGQPIQVTSWYRPPAVNRDVGGVPNSRHLLGLAADIRPLDGDVYRLQKWINLRWYGNLGYGAPKGFVHLDIGNGKGYQSGGAKGVRWNY